MIETPVLFLTFNRADTAAQVFAAIREARPKRLFFAADGPRDTVPGEADRCAEVRRLLDQVDWPCTVQTLLREQNLGCRRAVSQAIDWFFSEVEEGLVLEDDCLPHPDFFRFCEELLAYYRDDTRVMQICGSNFFANRDAAGASYHFSNYGPVWGWASWRRAWTEYDVDLSKWPEVKQQEWLKTITICDEEAATREQLYDQLYAGQIDTWDYQWGFAKLIKGGLSIVPAGNLISNIGFGETATHTKSGSGDPFAAMTCDGVDFPLRHPVKVRRVLAADRQFVDKFMLRKPAAPGLCQTLRGWLKGRSDE